MPELRPHHDPAGVMATPPSPRAVLFWDGTYWRAAAVDAAGHIQIDVLSNANLDDALQSVGTDRLIVRGQDQLFSLKGVLALHSLQQLPANDGPIDTASVLAGEYWVVTTIAAMDGDRALSRIVFQNVHDGTAVDVCDRTKAFVAGERGDWTGMTVLDVGDVIRAYLMGGLAGDWCTLDITGYRMTLET